MYLALMNTSKGSTTTGTHIHIVLVYSLLNPTANTQKASITIYYDIHRPIIFKSRRKKLLEYCCEVSCLYEYEQGKYDCRNSYTYSASIPSTKPHSKYSEGLNNNIF